MLSQVFDSSETMPKAIRYAFILFGKYINVVPDKYKAIILTDDEKLTHSIIRFDSEYLKYSFSRMGD